MSDDPWNALPPSERRFTVDEVRRACATLPPPRHWPGEEELDGWRPSASLVPIMDKDGEAAVVFTQRAHTLSRHGGDWVMPGGTVDPGDASPDITSRREAAEELGVPLESVEVAAKLDSHGPFATGFLLQFYLGFIAPGTVLHPNPAEVAAVELVPLSTLMADGAHHLSDEPPEGYSMPGMPHMKRPSLSTYGTTLHFFQIKEGEFAWGLQATTLIDLMAHLVAERLRS